MAERVRTERSRMAAYVVITRFHTRNPAELEQYAKDAPGFLAGHSIKFLARFESCEVVEGPGPRALRS
jgi:uncharacterized protein (DUF1330 family)